MKTENGFYVTVKEYVAPEKREETTPAPQKSECEIYASIGECIANTISATKEDKVDPLKIAENLKALADAGKEYQKLQYAQVREECISFPRKEEKDYVFKKEEYLDMIVFLEKKLK